MTTNGPPSARRGAFRWLTAVVWIMFGLSAAFSACVTHSGHQFAYQATCGPEPPTAWRLECTYIGVGASTLCLIPALVLLARGRRLGAVFALLLVGGSFVASAIAWFLPVLAAGLC